VLLSLALNLRLSRKMIVSACRCTVQLTVMGLVLVPVFASNNVWLVLGLAGAEQARGGGAMWRSWFTATASAAAAPGNL
jgi:hypothetical protein